MGRLNYLWDTNIVIYYFNRHFPPAGEKFIDNLLITDKPAVSVISEIELLCWRNISQQDFFILNKFIKEAFVYKLDDQIKLKTIELRKEFRLKLPDAIIAATSIVNELPLITRNLSDFKKIPQLKTINPFEIDFPV